MPNARCDSLFTVKGNAPETFETLHSIDWDRDADATFSQHTDKAHGRTEQRPIQILRPIPRLINYPHVRQVFRITRHRYTVKTGEGSSEYAYGLTSLSPEQAGPERRLALNRGHWTVENQNHRHRDTTFTEDACLMRTRHGPSNNAVLNNIALSGSASKYSPACSYAAFRSRPALFCSTISTPGQNRSMKPERLSSFATWAS